MKRSSEWPAIVAVSWAGSVSFLFVSLQPMLIGAWITAGMASAEASAALSANLLGALIGNLASIPLVARTGVRSLVAGGAVLTTLAMAAVAALPLQPATLWAALLAGGIGSGVLGAGAAASAGALSHPGRAFAIIIASQIVSGSIALLFAPDLLAAYGLPVLFYVVAALSALTLAFLPAFAEPVAGRSAESGGPAGPVFRAGAVLLLVSLAILYTGNNAVWAYLERIGHEAGLHGSDIGLALAVGQAASLVFAIAAGVFDRWNSRLAIAVGALLMCATAILFIVMPTVAGIAVGVAGFLGGVCFVVPYYMAELARRDASGRLMVWGQSAITIGLMAGPPAAAMVIEASSMTTMIWCSIALTATSALLLQFASRAERR